jgi:hypothetical protein
MRCGPGPARRGIATLALLVALGGELGAQSVGTADPQRLAIGSVVQYRVTKAQRNSRDFRRVVSALESLESLFAGRLLSSPTFAYYDRRSLAALQAEIDRMDDSSFDPMLGPMRGLLRQLDFLVVFSSSMDGPPSIRVIEVETGRVFASELCGANGETSCVGAVHRELSTGPAFLRWQRGRGALALDVEARAAALSKIAPQYESMIGRASAEAKLWDGIRARSRQRVLRSEIEALLTTIEVGARRCTALYRAVQVGELQPCIDSVLGNLEKLEEFK